MDFRTIALEESITSKISNLQKMGKEMTDLGEITSFSLLRKKVMKLAKELISNVFQEILTTLDNLEYTVQRHYTQITTVAI